MKIKNFIKTENGKKFDKILEGCNKNWECEYYENDNEYVEMLKDNNWSNEEIEEQLLSMERYTLVTGEFVIVIN